MELLITVTARQSQLQLLDMQYNYLTEQQERQVSNAVVTPECRVLITDEDYQEYMDEQDLAHFDGTPVSERQFKCRRKV